jgi:hypothetical protein
MRALLDVNVLIALLDADHSLHARATEWFASHARAGWASCPITQNGCVRIMCHPGYPNALPVRAVMERLAGATASELHQFWPDDISLLDRTLIDSTRIHGPRQLTDVYLFALALRHGARFATFDHSISAEAIKGAKAQNVVTL